MNPYCFETWFDECPHTFETLDEIEYTSRISYCIDCNKN